MSGSCLMFFEPSAVNTWLKNGMLMAVMRHDRQSLVGALLNPNWYCGYVMVPPEHSAFGLDYENERFRVFNRLCGLTYSGACPGDLLEELKRCRCGHVNTALAGWWLGFDTNHGYDADIGEVVDAATELAHLLSGGQPVRYLSGQLLPQKTRQAVVPPAAKLRRMLPE